MGTKAKKKSAPGRRRVEFRLDWPKAKEVCLVGDFNRWDLKAHPMRQNGNGAWTKTIMVFPGRYEYRFYADGQWLNDPNNPSKCENCFGTQNDIFHVSP